MDNPLHPQHPGPTLSGHPPGRMVDQQYGYLYASLRKKGLRPTSARIGLLQILPAQGPGAHAEDLFQELPALGLSFSLGTIYRVLGELERCGMVRREWPGGEEGGKARYALASGERQPCNYSFVCRACNRAIAVNDKSFDEQLRRQAQAGGFDLRLETMTIQVICNDCQASAPV